LGDSLKNEKSRTAV